MSLIEADHIDPSAPSQDLTQMFSYRDAMGRNAYYITPPDEVKDGFPMMIVLVKNDLAYVWLCPEEGHPGIQSVGHIPELDRGFTTGFQIPGNPTLILNEFVIPIESALAVAIEYHQTGNRSTSIEWYNLDHGC